MPIYRSDVVVVNSIDKETDLVMYEKRTVETSVLGINFGTYTFERTTSPYVGEKVLKSKTMGFKKD